jgi:hypothetical protein
VINYKNMEKLIEKIKENGYWKVIIRPDEFEAKLIDDRESASKIIENNAISLRGWSYPYIDPREGILRSGIDSVSSLCDWTEGGHFEFWKFYLNGQFVHYFSMVEDYRMKKKDKERVCISFAFSKLEQENPRFLSIINALYTITEIFLFAANIAKAANFGDKTEIVVELGNVDRRTLFFWDESYRMLNKPYTAIYQPITESIVVQTEDLIGNPAGLALDFAINIFKDFNWKDVNKEVFVGDQKKLIEKRF